MTKAAIRKGLRKLPVEDRVEILDELVHLVAADQRDLPLPQWQKDLLDQRLAEFEKSPEDTMTLEEFQKKIRGAIKGFQRKAKRNAR